MGHQPRLRLLSLCESVVTWLPMCGRTERWSCPMSIVYRPSSARHRRLTAALGLGAFLGGCTVGPDFRRPETRQPDGDTSENLSLEAAAGKEAEQSLPIGPKISAGWWR